MSDALAALKAELERFGEEDDGATSERGRRMASVPRDAGECLGVLVRPIVARRVLEAGQSNGYGKGECWAAKRSA